MHASASLGVREDDRHYQQTRPMHECACTLMERMEATLQLQQALGEAEDAAVSMENAGKVPGSFLLSLEVARGLQGSSQQEGELLPALALEPGVS